MLLLSVLIAAAKYRQSFRLVDKANAFAAIPLPSGLGGFG